MAWYHRLANTVRPGRLSSDLDREMEFHLAERIDELMEAGMSEAEARREARLRFGNPLVQKERTRDRDTLPWLESLIADLRYALRSLRSHPGFALVAVLSLGLGIGANTAIFSLIDAVMLRPLPVHEPEELVQVTMGDAGIEEFTNPIWEEVRDRQDLFSGVFAFAGERFDLDAGGEVRNVDGAWVSGGFFTTLGVRAAAGRVLAPADDLRGCPAAAVLGHAFWRGAYGGDAGVVGRTMSLNGHPFEIVGVADPAFSGVEVGRGTQVYAPLCAKAIVQDGGGGLDERGYWFLRIMGRLRDDITAAEAHARLSALAPAVFGATLPADWDAGAKRDYLETRLNLRPAANGPSGVRHEYRDPLLILMAVVGLVLLIACANVANLLLTRAATRRREMAIRLAIGAGRGRIVRQLLTESFLIALLGAAAGLLFAAWGSGLVVRLLSTRQNPVWLDLSIDGRVLAFTLAVAAATALLFGLAPAWRSAGVDLQAAMQANGRGIAEGGSRLTAGKLLVVGQIALSLVLVLGAGLLLGSFRGLTTLDPGFRREGVLLVSVDLRRAEYTGEQVSAVRREVLERLRAAPGVTGASAAAITPISGTGWNGRVSVDGYTPTGEMDAMAFFNAVSDDYFATLGTPLLAGRDFGEEDAAGSAPVAVVNQAFARKFLGGADPLGARIRIRNHIDESVAEIVGVVGDTKYRSLREETEPLVYLAIGQQEATAPWSSFELVVGGRGPARALVPTVGAVVGEVNRGITLRYTTLSEQVGASLTRERLLATLSGFLGALALLLAAVGLYGTMAYTVAQRRGEIGVRIALGAARARVTRLVLGEVGRLVVAGVLVGAVAAVAAARWISAFLFGLTPLDPATWVASALVLAAVALAAGAVPAWRAARMDPATVLREG